MRPAEPRRASPDPGEKALGSEAIVVKRGSSIGVCSTLLALVLWVIPLSCMGRSGLSLSLIQEAHELLAEAVPIRQDLEGLLAKLEGLGTRFPKAEDTLREGKSLVHLAEMDVIGLRERYGRAEELLVEAAQEGRGNLSQYAVLLREAVRLNLELLDLQAEYLRAVSDFLDVLPYAEDRSQLGYYLDALDRLSGEMADKSQAAASAAEGADSFRRENGL